MTSDKIFSIHIFVFISLIIIWRIIILWFSKTDLFVDEAQYWLWGQNLDFGYYSKPPLIGWVIRFMTEVAQSNSEFWVRFPIIVFHSATAFIIGKISHHLFGGKTVFWVVISYLTLPMVTLGSLVISTDTIMAPFWALSLLFYIKLIDDKRSANAILCGLFIGLSIMAKYSGLYFYLCMVVAAISDSHFRISRKNIILIIAAGLFVVFPNIIWNLLNGYQTFFHTLENASWGTSRVTNISYNYAELLEFFGGQFAVFGPILFIALLYKYATTSSVNEKFLTCFSFPILLIICFQAFFHKANANWAVMAYLSGLILVIPWMLNTFPKLLKFTICIGIILSILAPLTAVFPEYIRLSDGRPIVYRIMGRSNVSRQIISYAKNRNIQNIVAENRDILADLYYTGRDSGLSIYAITNSASPRNYYQANYPLNLSDKRKMIYVGTKNQKLIMTMNVEKILKINTNNGAYYRKNIFIQEVKNEH